MASEVEISSPVIGAQSTCYSRAIDTQSTCDTRVLTRVVEPHLLRAVSPKKVMERFGYHLRPCFLDGAENISQSCREYYALEQVQCYDYFVSHEWSTGRFQKWLALCFYNNFVPAVLASGLASVIAMALEISGVLPSWGFRKKVVAKSVLTVENGMWPGIVSPVVYVVMLLFWQHIRQLLPLGRIHIFFDRFCVHQSDQELKTAAILGIGGFIERSNMMVVLWSPMYFTRLWCAYEIATWTHLRKPDTKLIFVPTQGVVMILACQVFTYGGVLYSLFGRGRLFYLISIVYIVFGTVLETYSLKTLIGSLSNIYQQLVDFRVSKAACFCCSVEHCLPTSGLPINCDKELVCQTLAGWGQAYDSERVGERSVSSGLKEFESQMTRVLAEKLVRQLGSRKTTLALVFASVYPWFWYLCVRIREQASLGSSVLVWREVINSCGTAFINIPLVALFSLHVAKRLSVAKSRSQQAVLIILPPLIGSLSISLPLYLHTQVENPYPQLVVLIVFAAAFFFLCRRKPLLFDGVELERRNEVYAIFEARPQ